MHIMYERVYLWFSPCFACST